MWEQGCPDAPPAPGEAIVEATLGRVVLLLVVQHGDVEGLELALERRIGLGPPGRVAALADAVVLGGTLFRSVHARLGCIARAFARERAWPRRCWSVRAW